MLEANHTYTVNLELQYDCVLEPAQNCKGFLKRTYFDSTFKCVNAVFFFKLTFEILLP